MRPKILIIAASLRAGSHNARLAALAAKELTLAEADVTRISLADYALPIFDADLMADSGLPPPAIELKRMLTAHRGVFIATPEYSASVPPLLKNAIDWMSRGHERGEPSYAAYKGRVFAVGAASPASAGSRGALGGLRIIMELGCGALNITEVRRRLSGEAAVRACAISMAGAIAAVALSNSAILTRMRARRRR